jgi:hypothetical protein
MTGRDAHSSFSRSHFARGASAAAKGMVRAVLRCSSSSPSRFHSARCRSTIPPRARSCCDCALAARAARRRDRRDAGRRRRDVSDAAAQSARRSVHPRRLRRRRRGCGDRHGITLGARSRDSSHSSRSSAHAARRRRCSCSRAAAITPIRRGCCSPDSCSTRSSPRHPHRVLAVARSRSHRRAALDDGQHLGRNVDRRRRRHRAAVPRDGRARIRGERSAPARLRRRRRKVARRRTSSA